MKSLAKQILIKSTICILLLGTGSISAGPRTNIDAEHLTKAQTNYIFFAPQVMSQGTNYSSLFTSTQHYSALLTNNTKHSQLARCAKKKNELYELTTIISDKLHVLLSYFDETPKYQFADKRENKEALPIEG
ncbi:hypothetical protein Q4489_10650 [Thalassotalea sp. 1_MG-2023]|uniref:hypothetical protein n=1 Tax=Thalassotalea sp. 1_MG-2023 TaxID=3062680 RepID=UPI0026E11F7A|nr:hypothetical protein [Thalassotalea sp. 1_MG-2023]MDO6427477.1 hypothetical protein [Thalassotalea sp. 1_MG-2023]